MQWVVNFLFQLASINHFTYFMFVKFQYSSFFLRLTVCLFCFQVINSNYGFIASSNNIN